MSTVGATELFDWMHGGDTAAECAEQYVAERFDDVQIVTSGREPTIEHPDEAGVPLLIAHVRGALLPPPTGDVWILPAETVFGRETFAFWDGPDRGAVYLPATEEFVYRTIVPLPEGWDDVRDIPFLSTGDRAFLYGVRGHIVDGRLFLERTVRWNAGTTPEDELSRLDAEIQKIRELERNALVLERLASPSGR